MNLGSRIGSALCLVACLGHASVSAGNYQVHELTRSGYDNILLRDVNNHGQMLGTVYSSSTGHRSNFIYANGSFVDLPKYELPGWDLFARGLSDGNVVVGTARRSDMSLYEGFVYTTSGYERFTLPDANESEFRGISPDGRYVTGFAMRHENDDADGSRSVLYSFVLDRSTGALTKWGDTVGDQFFFPQGVNDAGVVAAGGRGLFDTKTSTFTSPGTFDGRTIGTYDVSNTGLLAANVSDDVHVNMWALAGRAGALERLELSGSAYAYGVNDAGVVVGYFSADITDINVPLRAFYAVTSVPEPTTLALWLCGWLSIGVISRRRRP